MQRKIILFTVVVWAVILISHFVSKRDARIQSAFNKQRQLQKSELVAEKAAEWRHGTFIPAASEKLPGAITNSVLTKHLDLTSDQKAKLSQITQDFFCTFKDINFDRYLAFKTASRSYEFNFDGSIGKSLQQRTGQGVSASTNAIDRAKLAWQIMVPPNRNGITPEIESVDPATMQIHIQTSTKPESVILRQSLQTLNNLAHRMVNTLVAYNVTPETILKKDGKLKFAVISTICTFNTSPDPSPITMTYYWSENDHNWMPWELAVDYSSHYYTLY